MAKTSTSPEQNADAMMSADTAVVGGGLAGYAIAISMAEQGARVALIDRNQDPLSGDHIRTTTINRKSYDHLKALGVVEKLAEASITMTPLRAIRVSDEKSRPRPRFAVADELISWREDDEEAPLGYVFRNADVMAALHDLVDVHPLITCHYGVAIKDFTPKHHIYGDAAAALYAEDGRVFAAQLVIAADGRNSPIRTAAGLRSITRKPGQTAIVADIKCARPHQHMAWQRFIKGGPAALMPIGDDRLMSLVWSMKTEDAEVLMAADDASFAHSLMDHFGDGFGTLSLASTRLTWPLELHHAMKPFSTRLALAGDAAHAIHPLAGQGYNLALGDAMALAGLAKDAQSTGSDLGAQHGLKRYARQRFTETAAMTLATDGLNAVFSFGGPLSTMATSLGMAVLNATPFKKLAVQAASGPKSK